MTTATNASNHAYVQFCQALIAECERLGLKPLRADTESGLPQNEGWCFLRFSEGGAALIIPRGKTRLGALHSHVDLSGKAGHIALPKKNGKVVCHFAPDVELAKAAIPAFVGAAKRATLAPTPKAPAAATPAATPVATPAATPVATPAATPAATPVTAADSSYGDAEVASWSASQEEPEEEELEGAIALVR